jgi:hypothetical protein
MRAELPEITRPAYRCERKPVSLDVIRRVCRIVLKITDQLVDLDPPYNVKRGGAWPWGVSGGRSASPQQYRARRHGRSRSNVMTPAILGTSYRYCRHLRHYSASILVLRPRRSARVSPPVPTLRTFLADQGALLDAIQDQRPNAVEQTRLIGRGRQIAKELGTLAPDQTRAILMTLLNRVDVRPDRVEINIRRERLLDLLAAQAIDLTAQGGKPGNESDNVLTLMVTARLRCVGREMRLLVENTDDQTTADPGLLRIVARAHDVQARLMQNTDLTVHGIANQERVSANYVYRLLRLPSLAPDIITAIINGKNPPQLTAKKLMRLTPQIPVDWAEQRKLLGFQ